MIVPSSGMEKNKLNNYLLLYSGIIIYSLSSVMSKTAAGHSVSSWKFFAFYGLALSFLGVYALLWQQILKCFSLITAYSNRPLVTILGMVWGWLFFGESVTPQMILGSAVIIIGIRLVVAADA